MATQDSETGAASAWFQLKELVLVRPTDEGGDRPASEDSGRLAEYGERAKVWSHVFLWAKFTDCSVSLRVSMRERSASLAELGRDVTLWFDEIPQLPESSYENGEITLFIRGGWFHTRTLGRVWTDNFSSEIQTVSCAANIIMSNINEELEHSGGAELRLAFVDQHALEVITGCAGERQEWLQTPSDPGSWPSSGDPIVDRIPFKDRYGPSHSLAVARGDYPRRSTSPEPRVTRQEAGELDGHSHYQDYHYIYN